LLAALGQRVCKVSIDRRHGEGRAEDSAALIEPRQIQRAPLPPGLVASRPSSHARVSPLGVIDLPSRVYLEVTVVQVNDLRII
jgi:hypothetical protein